MDLVPFFVPLWLIIPAVFVTRPHAFPSLQTRLLLRAVTRLFAPLGHSGPLKAQQGLGVGYEEAKHTTLVFWFYV